MADTYTNALRLRQKTPGTLFTQREAARGVTYNNWGTQLNADLTSLDEIIGKVCSPSQIAVICERLKDKLTFLGGAPDGL